MRTAHPWVLPTQPASRALLLAAGVTEAMIRSRVRAGDLVPVRQGVYLSAAVWPAELSAQHLVRAHAEQMVNPESVISHQSAAVAWALPAPGFGDWRDLPVSVTLPVGGHSSRSRATIHRVGPLPAHHVQRDAEGYPVTSPARTAVDLAADLALPEALVVLDAAARRICESLLPRVRRRDYANPRLAGAATALLIDAADRLRIARLRPTLALVNATRESAAESLSAGHMELAGLPRPTFQPRIRTERGTFYPDCLWEGQGLIGECDGAVKYLDASAVVLEREREQVLRDLNYGIVRWQAKEIMTNPACVVDRIARALSL